MSVAPRKVLLLAPVSNRLAEYETSEYTFSPLRRNTAIFGRRFSGSSFCKPFDPEWRFFVETPKADTQSIPVKVVTGKVAKPEKRAGVGMYGKAHPPHTTGHRNQALRKAFESKRTADSPIGAAVDSENRPTLRFPKEKRSLKFNGC
jgi:hypothetical protein